jgi:hypothetical protein
MFTAEMADRRRKAAMLSSYLSVIAKSRIQIIGESAIASPLSVMEGKQRAMQPKFRTVSPLTESRMISSLTSGMSATALEVENAINELGNNLRRQAQSAAESGTRWKLILTLRANLAVWAGKLQLCRVV